MSYTLGSLSGNSIAAATQLTVREELLPTLHQSLEETDDIFRMMFSTSKGVKKSSPIGRGYNVIRVYVCGGAGGAKFISPLGGNVVSGTFGFNNQSSSKNLKRLRTIRDTIAPRPALGTPGSAPAPNVKDRGSAAPP